MPLRNVRNRRARRTQERLLDALTRLMTVESWDDRVQLLRDEPRLLEPEIDEFLQSVLEHSRQNGLTEYAEKLPFWIEFLARCRKMGVQAAVNRTLGGGDIPYPEQLDPVLRGIDELEARVPGAHGEVADAWAEIAAEPSIQEDYPLLHAVAHCNRGAALERLFAATGRPDVLDAAREALERGISLLPDGSPYRPVVLLSLAEVLGETGNLDDVLHAGRLVDEAVRADPSSAGRAAGVRFGLGLAAYEHAHSPEALDFAIAEAERAHEAHPDPDTRRLAAEQLAQAYIRRHQLGGVVDDLATAVSWAEISAQGAEPGSEEWGSATNSLAICLRDWHRETNDRPALDRAIEIHRHALSVLTAESRLRLHHLHGLGVTLRWRSHDTGDADDLMRAAEAHKLLIGEMDQHDDLYVAAQSGYGNTLRELYLVHGDTGHLRAAITAHRSAMEAVDRKSSGWLRSVDELATDLRRLALEAGDLAALDEAIALLRDVAGEEVGTQDHNLILFTLGSCLSNRYDLLREERDGAEAVRLLEVVVARTAPGMTSRPVRLSNLAGVLVVWHTRPGAGPDADEGLDRAERLLEEAARDSQGRDRAMYLSNLSSSILARSAKDAPLPRIRRAVEASTEACALTPPDANDGVAFRLGLASALQILAHATDDEETFDRSLAVLREACAGLDRYPGAVLTLGKAWGEQAAAAGRWTEAIEAYGYASAAMEVLVRGASLRDHKEQWLGVAEGLATSAATAFLRTGDPWSAAEALERGRARLLAEAMELSSDAHEPRNPRADIVEAARYAPLAYIVAGDDDAPGFALVVNEDGIQVHDLPDLSSLELLRTAAAFFTAYEEASHAWQEWLERLDATARWLWSAVMGPLLDTVPDAEQLVLIPVRYLATLPLHVAWSPDEEASTGRTYVIDRLPVVYAPSAHARAESCRRAAARPETAAHALLAVDDPQPVLAAPLTFSSYEVDAATTAVRDGDRLTGPAATREAVLDAAAGRSVLHFSCHGYAHWGSVLDSHLLLANSERLTVRDLLSSRVDGTRLVVLSACETSLPGLTLSDEVVGIATAYLQAGATGVIGSMWRVPDAGSALLFSRFYELWPGGDADPAEALRLAQQWLRDSTNRDLRAAFPEIIERYAPIPPSFQEVWEKERDFAHPVYWAAFTCLGA